MKTLYKYSIALLLLICSTSSINAQLELIASSSDFAGSNKGYIQDPIAFEGELYMRWTNNANENFLVKQVGDSAIVIPPPSGFAGSGNGYMNSPIVFNSKLYMRWEDINDEQQLVEFDGDSLRVITPPAGFTGANSGYLGSPIINGDQLYLRWKNASGEFQLVNFDGTSLNAITSPSGFSGSNNGYSGSPIISDGILYMLWQNTVGAYQLVSYNGSAFTAYTSPAGYTTSGYGYQGIVESLGDQLLMMWYSSSNQGNLVVLDGGVLTEIPFPTGFPGAGSGWEWSNPVVLDSGCFMYWTNDVNEHLLVKYEHDSLVLIPSPVEYAGANASYIDELFLFDTTLCMLWNNSGGVSEFVRFENDSLILVPSPAGFSDADRGYSGSPIVFNDKLYMEWENNSEEKVLVEFDGTNLSVISPPAGFSGVGSGYTDEFPIVMDDNLYMRWKDSGGQFQLAKFDGNVISAITSPPGFAGVDKGYQSNPYVVAHDLFMRWVNTSKHRVLVRYAGENDLPTITANGTDPILDHFVCSVSDGLADVSFQVSDPEGNDIQITSIVSSDTNVISNAAITFSPIISVDSLITDGLISFSNIKAEGTTTIYITANDGADTTVSFDVFVGAAVAPFISEANALKVYLDSAGEGMLADSTVLNAVEDNCGIDSIRFNIPPMFTCEDLGNSNPSIEVIVIDTDGNVDTIWPNVEVVDNIQPEFVAQHITAYLDVNGSVTLTGEEFDAGSWDNCGIDSSWISKSVFKCNDIGVNKVKVKIFDTYGNVDSLPSVDGHEEDSINVTILDTLGPNMLLHDTILYLNANGQAGLDSASLIAGTADNCTSIDSLVISKRTFNCNNVGNNVITVTAWDEYGNNSSATSRVTVRDTIKPTVIQHPDTTLYLSSSTVKLRHEDMDNGSYDNCGLFKINLTQLNYTVADLGVNQEYLIVYDKNNNLDSASVMVTVKDTVLPNCKDLTVTLEDGNVTIDSNALDNGSFAGSGIDSIWLSRNTFYCHDAGAVPVTMFVRSNTGIIKSCTSSVTVLRNIEIEHVSCYGEADGAIVFDCNDDHHNGASTGAAPTPNPPKYSLNYGGFFEVDRFDGLTPGTYNVRMRQYEVITDLGDFTITEPSELTLTTANVNPLCANDSLWISAVATGGSGDYEYALVGLDTNETGAFGFVLEGNYVVVVSDANGCSVTSDSIYIELPEMLSAGLASSSETCIASSDGIITVTATGGKEPYMYQLDDGPSQSSNVFEGLAEGTYDITVTDANGCKWFWFIPVQRVAELTIAKEVIGSVDCGGDEDLIYGIESTGGTPPLQWFINGDSVSSIDYESLPAGTYTFGVSDYNGCSVSLAPITKGDAVVFSASAKKESEILCFNAESGSISITALGGTPPYEYSFDGGDNYGAEATASNLGPGVYELIVRDANDCTIDLNEFSFSQPTELEVSLIKVQNVSCKGGSDGEILTVVSGGIQPYKYSYNGVDFSISKPAHNQYSTGSYVVYVKDANGCVTVSNGISISEPAELEASVEIVAEPLCFGQASGIIKLTNLTGGTAPYTWYVNGEVVNDSILGNLNAGSYTSTLIDFNGCAINLNDVILEEPEVVELILTQTALIYCNGNATAAIAANATGGKGKFSYTLNQGSSTVNPNFENLSAGTYLITATDDNGCFDTKQIIISEPSSMEMDFQVVHISCGETTGGEIVIAASGGTRPYQYSLNGLPFQGDSAFANLNPGTYNIQIKDALGCLSEIEPVSVLPSLPFSAYISSLSNLTCYQSNDGGILVSVSGGEGPFTYEIANQSPQNHGAFSNMAAGTYVITVTDGRGCVDQAAVSLSEPRPLLLTALDVVNPTCEEAGSISLSASGGTAPYNYILNGMDAQSHGIFNNLLEGNYSFEIIDSEGCVSSLPAITLEAPEGISKIDIIYSDQFCFGGNTNVSMSSPGAGIEYSMDGVSYNDNGLFPEITAGNYIAYVRNADGCEGTKAFTISQVDEIIGHADILFSPLCFGDATASVLLNGTGGTLPFTYSANGISFQASPILEELYAGTHLLTIKDAEGCLGTLTVTIDQPSQLQISGLVSHETAPNNGAISMLANGGKPPYVYGFWDYQLDTLVLGLQNPTGMSAGNYTIGAADSYGCWDTVSVIIENQIGIGELREDIAINVYPNPSTGLVSIKMDKPEVVKSFEIINTIGEVVFRKSNQMLSVEMIDLSNNAKGAYYVRVITDNGIQVETLMLQ